MRTITVLPFPQKSSEEHRGTILSMSASELVEAKNKFEKHANCLLQMDVVAIWICSREAAKRGHPKARV